MIQESKIVIDGCENISGDIEISGSKNSILPIMAATLLSSNNPTIISNVPKVGDVFTLIDVMKNLGAEVEFQKSNLVIDNSKIHNTIMSSPSQKMRASILVAGPLLSRFNEVIITPPGGCTIGERPINWHLSGLENLGAKSEVENERLRLYSKGLYGADIKLPFPSVGATENLIMASVMAKGVTTIYNAAREPEVVDLIEFLRTMGAKIEGTGSSELKIKGVSELNSIKYRIIPDRVEAITFAQISWLTRDTITLSNVSMNHIAEPLRILKLMGLKINSNEHRLSLSSSSRPKSFRINTAPYPGFPTDMQPLFLSIAMIAEGNSYLRDTIFPQRFNQVPELRKMGAKIIYNAGSATVTGVDHLTGSDVQATDLRSGAALILAGLAADGQTTISGVRHIQRGYENIISKLKKVGAKIKYTH